MQEAIGSKSHQGRKASTEMVKGLPEDLGGTLQHCHIVNVYGDFASARKLSIHLVLYNTLWIISLTYQGTEVLCNL